MAFNPANPYDVFFSGQGRRSYNAVPDAKQFSFLQAFNPNYVNGSISGQFQPLTTNDQGALRVDVGSGINIELSGVTVNVGNVAVTGVTTVTGTVSVNGFDTLTGQVAQLQVQMASLTGTISSTWQKVKTAGYATVFGAATGAKLVNKVQGYTKTITQPSFIQLFDTGVAPSAGATPDFVASVQTTNNWFIDLAEAGVQFNNGLQIVNSSTPDVYTALGASDFIATAVVK